MWHRVVAARFGMIPRLESKEVRVRHGCGLWKSIHKLRDRFGVSFVSIWGLAGRFVFGRIGGLGRSRCRFRLGIFTL